MIQKFSIVVLSLFLFACNDSKTESTDSDITTENQKPEKEDENVVNNHSYSNIDEINTTHLHLNFDIDFDNKKIKGVARHKMNNTGVEVAIFDVQGLDIQKVTLGEDKEVETTYKIGKEDKLLGAPLKVDIEQNTSMINIYYETTEESQALDWLDPALTGSKKHPFLYTQGQAILTRTWIPTQDTPENRITYSADVKVPSELLALMSANNPTEKNESGEYSFKMNQPIPSYLIALAVGELEYAQLGEKSGVYAEPYMIDAAASEFQDIPKMMDAAQELYGEYLWDMYDVIVLPHSFPFGGMENPRLTFATPTLIAGDRSLVSVIAHELAHSWSGNLVTNATWDDFWLNEGFTVYFENRIMEKIYGKEVANMLALIEFQELEKSIDKMMSEGHNEDTHLKLNLDERNPDDGMTDVAYVKGAFFLKTLEKEVGREKFDAFLREYFNAHQFETLTSESFIEYLNKNLLEKENIDFNVEEWIYGDGIPDNVVKITSDRFVKIKNLADKIKNGDKIPSDLKREDKTTQEWLAFIRHFQGDLDKEKMIAIDKQLNFRNSGNSEIMSEWFILGINNGYTDLRPDIKKFVVKVGRRKFLAPIYTALSKPENNSVEWAKEVYAEARPNYHAISFNTVDEILKDSE
ncbi:MAG: aminopeptidase [Fluviicola sp.]|nr:MAG: aminopeptidase [Fluviicola sp.]